MSKLKVDEIRSVDRSVSDSANIILANDGNVKIPSFVGMIAPFAMTTPPTGWLACDGTAVSRTTYADLFTAIGTTWGAGDGSNTFALPDLEGAFLRGVGTGTINSRNKVGPTNVGDFQEDQFQDHRHFMRDRGAGSGSVSGLYNIAGQDNSNVSEIDQNISAANNGYKEQNSNGIPRSGNETRPFNAGVKFCIKY